MKKNLSLLFTAVIAMSNFKTATAQSWSLTGNNGTKAATNFVGTTDSKALAFRTNNIEQMRIGLSGNVGIGTKTPLAKLHVDNGSFLSLSSAGCFQIGAATDVNLGLDYNGIQSRYNGASSRFYLNYFGGDVWIGAHNAAPTPAIYAATDGRVGIGSSAVTSGYALTVNGNSTFSGINITSSGTGINITNSGVYADFNSIKSGNGSIINAEKISTTSGSTTISCSNRGSGTSLQAVSSSGYGIYGYSTTGYGMFAQGLVNNGLYALTNDNADYYAGYFVGDVYSTTGVYAGSDQKLKQNIKDFSSAMDIINQLHPKQYDYRHDGNYKLMNLPQGNHYGLIAQDVEKILPGLVKNSKFDVDRASPLKSADTKNPLVKNDKKSGEIIDFKALNYTELIPVIIKGMQELNENLQQQIDEQKNRIDKLEKTIEKLSVITNTSSSNLSSENSGAYLKQNAPNPFTQNTIINCNVPSSAKLAQLMIYNEKGSQVKSFVLTNGINNITLNGGLLSSGQYVYSLLIDGKKVDSKKMILTK